MVAKAEPDEPDEPDDEPAAAADPPAPALPAPAPAPDEPDPEPAVEPPAPDEALDPDPVRWPTTPLRTETVPDTGAVSAVWSTAFCASSSAPCACSTAAWA